MSTLLAQSLDITHLALTAVPLLPELVLFGCSFWFARRSSDSARGCFVYMKVLYAVWILYHIFILAASSLSIEIDYLDSGSEYTEPDDLFDVFWQDRATLGIVFDVFYSIADALVILTISSLISGIGIAVSGSLRRRDRLLNLVSYAVAGILSIFAFVKLGLNVKVGVNPIIGYTSALMAVDDVYLVFACLMLVSSLGLLGLAILVAIQYRDSTRLSTVIRYLIVCCALLVLRAVWNVVASSMELRETFTESEVILIAEPILDTWTMFVILTLLYCVGIKQGQGLWTTPPTLTNGKGDYPDKSIGTGTPQYQFQELPSHARYQSQELPSYEPHHEVSGTPVFRELSAPPRQPGYYSYKSQSRRIAPQELPV